MGFSLESKVLKLQKQMAFLKQQYDCIRKKGCACVNEGYDITEDICIEENVVKHLYYGVSMIGNGDCSDAPYGIFSSDTNNTTPLVTGIICSGDGETGLIRQIVEGLRSIGETQAYERHFRNGGDGIVLQYKGYIDFDKYRLSPLNNLSVNYFAPFQKTSRTTTVLEIKKGYKVFSYEKEGAIPSIKYFTEQLEERPKPSNYRKGFCDKVEKIRYGNPIAEIINTRGQRQDIHETITSMYKSGNDLVYVGENNRQIRIPLSTGGVKHVKYQAPQKYYQINLPSYTGHNMVMEVLLRSQYSASILYIYGYMNNPNGFVNLGVYKVGNTTATVTFTDTGVGGYKLFIASNNGFTGSDAILVKSLYFSGIYYSPSSINYNVQSLNISTTNTLTGNIKGTF